MENQPFAKDFAETNMKKSITPLNKVQSSPLQHSQSSLEEYRRREQLTVDGEKYTVETLDTGNFLDAEFESKLTKWNDWATGFMLVYRYSFLEETH